MPWTSTSAVNGKADSNMAAGVRFVILHRGLGEDGFGFVIAGAQPSGASKQGKLATGGQFIGESSHFSSLLI